MPIHKLGFQDAVILENAEDTGLVGHACSVELVLGEFLHQGGADEEDRPLLGDIDE